MAFRAAVASASGLDVAVPGCPGWTLLDLVLHLRQATTVAAGQLTFGRLLEPGTSPATASARGAAGDLVLVSYGRGPLESLELDGDRRVFDRLIAWDPDA